jgi:iron(II)-dependent oxidoreductase
MTQLTPEPRARTASTAMVWVAGGAAVLGSTPAELDHLVAYYAGAPRAIFEHELGGHRVELDGFFLDRCPVTNAAFAEFMADGGYRRHELWSQDGWSWRSRREITAPAFWSDPAWATWTAADHPVVGVSWYEADAYARWANKRLPTETEWERAARGSDGRRFPWGDRFELGRANTCDQWLGEEVRAVADWRAFMAARPWRHRCLTTPVGTFAAGGSPAGALDMAGNIWEWCADWYAAYDPGVARDPRGPAFGRDRICRGGSFAYFGFAARTTDRGHHVPTYRSLGIGLRCARSAEARATD